MDRAFIYEVQLAHQARETLLKIKWNAPQSCHKWMKFTQNKKHSSRLNTFYCFSNWRRPNWLQKVSFLYPQIKPEHHLNTHLRLLPLVGWIRFYEAWFCVIIIGLLGEVMTWFYSLTAKAKSRWKWNTFWNKHIRKYLKIIVIINIED